MITNARRNNVGTLSFDAKFPGMRKPQEFIVYPVKGADDGKELMLQSDTRIGKINTETGLVRMSPPISSGAYGVHLAFASDVCTLDAETLLMLKAKVASTTGAGGTIVKLDNGGAINVLGGAQ